MLYFNFLFKVILLQLQLLLNTILSQSQYDQNFVFIHYVWIKSWSLFCTSWCIYFNYHLFINMIMQLIQEFVCSSLWNLSSNSLIVEYDSQIAKDKFFKCWKQLCCWHLINHVDELVNCIIEVHWITTSCS